MPKTMTPGALASSVALHVIKHFEGLRLEVYEDAAGHLTVGYGHLVRPEDQLVLGQKIEPWEAEEFLKVDIDEATRAVVRLVKSELDPFQMAALVSFTFNLGAGNFGASTLLKKINASDHAAAVHEFKRWIFAGGKALEGLARRRDCEAGLFASGHAMTRLWDGPVVQ